LAAISIVDYGAGNLASVQNAFAALGLEFEIAHTPESILSANRLVLPGVGAAGTALGRMREVGMDEALTEAVRVRGRPMLGICLGMQLIADTLHEQGNHRGLGWVRGEVVALESLVVKGIVPHMGWNDAVPRGAAQKFFDPIKEREMVFYFAHSYTMRVEDEKVVGAYTNHGANLVSAVLDETVFAVQFHPEKSQQSGQQLIANFLNWKP
jgi:glutamine amidotransferase